MAPGTTAQLHLASKRPLPRREIGAGQRGFVQRLLRRHGCKTRWGGGPGLVWRKQRRLPLQVNLSFEMRCARVWLAQLAAELRWSPQFVARRQHRANFSQFVTNLVAWQSRQFTAVNQHQALVKFRKELISLPAVALSLKSELRLATDRIRETEFSPGRVGRFEASIRTHHLLDRERRLDWAGIVTARASRMQEIVAPVRQQATRALRQGQVRDLYKSRLPPVSLKSQSLTARLVSSDSRAAHSGSNMILAVQRREHRQSRLERMRSRYFADSTAVVLSSTATAADGRAESEMRLRRPERTWEQSHPHAFAPDMTLYRPRRKEDGQHQIAAALPEIITAVKAADGAAVSNKPVAFAEPDLSQLTDRVYAELERKLRNERIRRGL